MGISSLPTPSEAFFPFLLLANALTPVTVLVDGMRWAFLLVMGCSSYQSQGGGAAVLLGGDQQPAAAAAAAAADAQQQQQQEQQEQQEQQQEQQEEGEVIRKRDLVGVHVTRFNLLQAVRERDDECCVCLHGFEGEEEVSEVVSCRHLFHRGCLESWVSHLHSTCPLCRSIL